MKLSIIGYSRHGKDTVAELLREHYKMKFESSSLFCAERVMLPAFARTGKTYESVAECFDDRFNHRAFWHEEIAKYCTPLERLGREIWAKNDIYVGTRSYREFMACKNANLFNYSIWVDRSLHLQPKSRESNTMEPWMADFILDNNGSLSDLFRNLNVLMCTLYAKHGMELPRQIRRLAGQ